MKIIGYTYDAANHCPNCTREAAANGTLTREPPLRRETDEHGVAQDLVDRSVNEVGALFDTDENVDPRFCDDCFEDLT